MLTHFLSQLSLKNIYILLFYILIASNLIMMLRQKSLIFFLGYKIILLIYIGWWLVYCGLDILALILWIVYGSFIVVVFIFSFLWLDTQHPPRLHNLSPQARNAATITALLIIIIISSTNTSRNTNWLFIVQWLNHYELLNFHNSEEIEALGWGLSTDNLLLLILLSSLLSGSCILAVICIILAKKNKWTSLRRIFKYNAQSTRILTTGVRRQVWHQQEARSLLNLKKIYKHMHSRRA